MTPVRLMFKYTNYSKFLKKTLHPLAIQQLQFRNASRRAVMYVPGNDLRKVQKALTLKVDCIALDCEDGVAINKKVEARETIKNILDKELPLVNGPELSVRVNSVNSGLFEEDIDAVLSSKIIPPTILLPKVENNEELKTFSEAVWRAMMKRPESERITINLIMLIESARAIMMLPDICKEAQQLSTMAPIQPVGLIFGSDDLLADLGGVRSKSAIEILYARQRLVLVAKAFQLEAIDMVHIEYQDLNSLKKEAQEGAHLGYTGKQVIHPSQIPIVQDAFLPSKAAIEWAKGLIAAFHRHQENGQGAFTYRGSMIDMPLLKQAQNIIESSSRLD